MDDQHFLPNFDKKNSKAFTPIGVRNLLDQAVKAKIRSSCKSKKWRHPSCI